MDNILTTIFCIPIAILRNIFTPKNDKIRRDAKIIMIMFFDIFIEDGLYSELPVFSISGGSNSFISVSFDMVSICLYIMYIQYLPNLCSFNRVSLFVQLV